MQLRTPRDLGALARSRRKALGWSQQRLAEEAGVTRLWVSQFEGGKPTVQLGLVLRVLRVLDIRLHDEPADVSAGGIDLDALLADD